ncbi:MAG: hypothetical protein ACK5CA_13325 [Cyanobacteriota bacterium]|jgi:hypothetical protein
MTLQEIIQELDDLSSTDQLLLFSRLQKRWADSSPAEKTGDAFWQGVLQLRQVIEEEVLIFTDEDFADLRDRSSGRDVEIQ